MWNSRKEGFGGRNWEGYQRRSQIKDEVLRGATGGLVKEKLDKKKEN